MKNITYIILALLLLLPVQVRAGERKAVWIGSETCQSKPNSWLIYRTTVNADNLPAELMADIAVDSKYWLWINGEPVVFEGGLKRGPAPEATYFDRVDIAPYLKKGENTIALLVWHFGKNGFSHVSSGTAGLFFEALSPELEIVSDTSWKCVPYDAYGDTEAPHPNYRLPESNIRYDARRERSGWYMPGYKGKMANAVYIADASRSPFGRLVERPIPQWKNSGLRDYVSRRQSGDTIICKLPYNAQVTPWLKVKSPAGEKIDMLTDNYMGGSAANMRAEYITRDGVQEYESLGWINGHEMYYIVPEGVEVIDLKYRETGYDTDFTGSFECNDVFLNELWKRSARTLYITMRDNYMDCPDRERAQWWGDEVNELGETFYALSPSAWQLARKGIYELMNWQRDSGVIASPIPSVNWNRELPLQMLASVGWYGFYTQYFYSADSSFVADIYEPLLRYLHDVWELDGEGLVVHRAGDWEWGDWGEDIDIDILDNCWYFLALKAENEFAQLLGKEADARMIQAKMDSISNAFDGRFWDGTAYRTPSYKGATDDRAQAMAVVSGLASEDKYPALIEVLVEEKHASPYMEKYVLEALFKMGRSDLALARMRDRYAKMLAYEDYTTLFEGWGIGEEGFGGGTLNHAWSGGPLTLLSQKVCGIEPVTPGFKTFAVNPDMGDLKTAKAAVDTQFGLIEVSLRRNKNTVKAQITVPEGTCAFVPGRKECLGAGTHTVTIKNK